MIALLIDRDGGMSSERFEGEPRLIIGRRVYGQFPHGGIETFEYVRTDVTVDGKRVYRELPIGPVQ